MTESAKLKLPFAKATEIVWPTFEHDFETSENPTLKKQFALENIFHIADIHVCPKNHQHVAFAWQQMIAKIQTLTPNYKQDSLLVIAGDVFDNKTWLKASDISLFMSMIDDLERLELRTFIIPGNHDFNGNQMQTVASEKSMELKQNQDLSEDKILALLSKRPLRFVKHWSRSGVDCVDDVEFYFHSPVDGLTPRPTSKNRFRADGAPIITCAVAHESLRESGTCSGFSMEHAARFGVNDFSQVYDMSLFGDVHLAQRLAWNVCFCGSLAQKTRAEGIVHGMVRWHIRKNFTPEFVPLQQLSVWISAHVQNNEIPEDLPDPEQVTARGVQLFHRECTREFVHDLEMRLQKMYKQRKLDGVFDVARTNNNLARAIGERATKRTCIENNDSSPDETVVAASAIVFTDDQISQLLNERLMNLKHLDISTRERIHSLHKVQFNSSRFGQRLDWRIRFISFSNVYCFAGENHFNFDDLSNLSSLIGCNYTGKSSFFDVIILGIFNRCLRGTKADALHGNATSGYIKVVLSVGDDEYRIEHVWLMKTKVVVHVYKNGVNVSNATMTETNTYIEENIVGPLKVFENTVVALQERQFLVNLSPTDRYALISQIIELDGLKQAEKDNHTAILTLERMIKQQNKLGLSTEDAIAKMRQDLSSKKALHEASRDELETLKNTLKKATSELDSLNAQSYSEDGNYTEMQLENLRKQQQLAQQSYPFQQAEELLCCEKKLENMRQRYETACVELKAHEMLQTVGNANLQQQQQSETASEINVVEQLAIIEAEQTKLRLEYSSLFANNSLVDVMQQDSSSESMSQHLGNCRANCQVGYESVNKLKSELQTLHQATQALVTKQKNLKSNLEDNLKLKSEYEAKCKQIDACINKQQDLPLVLNQKLEQLKLTENASDLSSLQLVLHARKQEANFMLASTKSFFFASSQNLFASSSSSLADTSKPSLPSFIIQLLESIENRVETFTELETLINELQTANKQDMTQYQNNKNLIFDWLRKFECIQRDYRTLTEKQIPESQAEENVFIARLQAAEQQLTEWKTKLTNAEIDWKMWTSRLQAHTRYIELLKKQTWLKSRLSLQPLQEEVKTLNQECKHLEDMADKLNNARLAADNFETLTLKLDRVTEACKARVQSNKLKHMDIPTLQTTIDLISKRCVQSECQTLVLQTQIDNHEAKFAESMGLAQELADRRLYESLMNQKTGIANERMTALCQDIEIHCNRLLTKCTDFTLTVNFTGNIEMKINNTLTNTTVSAERASTFQKFLLDIVLRCVICYLIPSGCPRILLIDEGLGNADEEKKDMFCRQVLPVLAKEFEHVLIVSHIETIHEFTSCSCHIEMQPDGTSRLRFGHKPDDAHKLKIIDEFEADRSRIRQEKQDRSTHGLPSLFSSFKPPSSLPLTSSKLVSPTVKNMFDDDVKTVKSEPNENYANATFCDACSKQFANASTLKRHEKSKQHIINLQIRTSLSSNKRKQF